MNDFPPGMVWLVGACPGDPELLTMKALRLIEAADIVFHDALVGPGVRARVPASTPCISVGKRSGRHSLAQPAINDRLVAAAQSGKRVVRLKGGDPSIFGRSAEEMAALRAQGISVQICPGVTAASAAVASAGVSLTLRGVARQLRFLTAHARQGASLDLDWSALADPDTTLAVYMGKAEAAGIARNLLAAGLAGTTPILLVENASLPIEKILQSRLDLLPVIARAALGEGPALLLIGHAVARPEPATAACVKPALVHA